MKGMGVNMRYIIDRFEDKIAICEDETKKIIKIPKYKLPLEVKEGDCLIEEGGFIKINNKETEEKKNRMKEKMKELSN